MLDQNVNQWINLPGSNLLCELLFLGSLYQDVYRIRILSLLYLLEIRSCLGYAAFASKRKPFFSFLVVASLRRHHAAGVVGIRVLAGLEQTALGSLEITFLQIEIGYIE